MRVAVTGLAVLVVTSAGCTGSVDDVGNAPTSGSTMAVASSEAHRSAQASGAAPSTSPSPAPVPTASTPPDKATAPGALRTPPNPTPESTTPVEPNGGDALDSAGPGPTGATVTLPDDSTGAPTVVLVHGGAWVAGVPGSMQPLADELADRGMLVSTISYTTISQGGSYPGIVDDVACGVRHARAVADQLGATGPLVVIGHSAGAHLATVVALAPDQFGGGCPWPGTSEPDELVTLAGVFDIDEVEAVMRLLVGGTREQLPAAWNSIDPYALVELPTAGVGAFPITMLVGSDDRIAPPSVSRNFLDALAEAGIDADVHELPDVDHFTIIAPSIADAIESFTG